MCIRDRPSGVLGETPAGLGHLDLDGLRPGTGLLAVEDPHADLDGLADDPRGIVVFGDQPDGALVADDQAVDAQRVADDADLAEGQGSCSFHGYLVAPYARDLTE